MRRRYRRPLAGSCHPSAHCTVHTALFRRYNGCVARGWESKSVEEQINEREADTASSGKETPSRSEIEQKSKREGIMLVRSRTVTSLEATHDDRYRALLQRTLAHLDSELAKLA